jgi:hypothetical protein
MWAGLSAERTCKEAKGTFNKMWSALAKILEGYIYYIYYNYNNEYNDYRKWGQRFDHRCFYHA